MKKILIFLAVVIVIISVIGVKYASYKVEYNAIIKENAEYEQYKDKEIYGLDVASILNKVVDKNRKNNIEKDEEGFFIQNETDSIKMDISIIDEEEIHQIPMETIYKNGPEQFAQIYKDIKFKCSKIEYHEKTGRIKYILFEEITKS